MKCLLFVPLAILSLSAFGQTTQVKLGEKEKQQLATFMSNFSEVSLPDFDQSHPLTQTQLLKFAFDHKQYQEWMASIDRGARMKHGDKAGQTKILSKDYIVGVIKRYFGITLNWSSLPASLITKKALTIHYGGERIEGTWYTGVKSMMKVGDSYRFTGDYISINTGDEEEVYGTVEATLKKTSDGWNLISHSIHRKKF